MRFKCLALDHDDTAVNNSQELHYPAYMRIMPLMRPGSELLSFEDFMRVSYEPGFSEYLRNELGFSEEEIENEHRLWIDDVADKRARFFPGFTAALKEYKAQGGIICIVSHSEKEFILRDYRGQGVEPDAVYGYEPEAEKNKPHAYPLLMIMKSFKLEPEDILVVDDLRFGAEMAKRVGAKFAYAAWACRNAQSVSKDMQDMSDFCLASVEEFRKLVLL